MRVIHLLVLATTVSSLTACSTVESTYSTVKKVGVDSAKYVGLLPQTNIKVPDYYSTQYLPKKYEMGQSYDLDNFSCDEAENC